ncbi:MAG: hypothetical protein H0W86_08920 [Armatimonadetes bacterium]|nr:hypothetical protein [Armatimonadota bacterium]
MKNTLVRGLSNSHRSLRLAAGAMALLGLIAGAQAQTTVLASVATNGAAAAKMITIFLMLPS